MMLGDFSTKPLQGSLFKRMRDVVMGLQPITILKTEEELKAEKLTAEGFKSEGFESETTEDLKGIINSNKETFSL